MKKERKTGKMENEGYTVYYASTRQHERNPLYKNISLLLLQESEQDGRGFSSSIN